VDWNAASGILKGVYETLFRYPAIVVHQPMKAIINTCQVSFEKLLEYEIDG